MLNCKKANILMMKYMDGNITDEEATELKKHINECRSCKEDFVIYNRLLDEFIDMDGSNIISAPEGFEIQVMERINALEPIYAKHGNSMENLMYAICGGVSIAAGSATIFIVNKDAIINTISSSEFLSGYASMLVPVGKYAVQLMTSFETISVSLISYVELYAQNFKYVSLIIFILLVVAQIVISKKDKVEV